MKKLIIEIRKYIADWLISLALKMYPPGPEQRRLAVFVVKHFKQSIKEYETQVRRE